jgi:ubiquinone/menaquinone biosynthesis C-methylase UbiE
MSVDSAGYVTEVAYMPGFYEYMAPTALHYVAGLNGATPPSIQQPFRYLELGCGLGQTFTTLAAANPAGQFVGVDVNPAHIDSADKDIKAGGLTNASAVLSDFASLSPDYGEFDFIGVHGVLSWVTPAVQHQLLNAVDRHLKPGGLLLVSYNALPGWAQLSPIREMIRQYAAKTSGSPLEKIAGALKYLEYVSGRKSEYFAKNDAARQHVQHLFKSDRRYLVHEYLNEHWRAFYFHEVAALCRPYGFQFAGTLPAVTNHWAMCVAPELHDLFATAADRATIETHKDFCANFMFRWDIYSKNALRTPTAVDRVRAGTDLYFSLTELRVPYHVHLGCGAVEIKGPEYELLQLILTEKSRTLPELIAAAGLPEAQWPTLVQALDRGVATGFVSISAAPIPAKQPINAATTYTFSHAYNRAAAHKSAFSGEHAAVASPLTRTGHILKEFDAGIVTALVEHGPDNLPQAVARLMATKNRTLKQNGVPVTNPVAQNAIIQSACAEFFKKVLPELVQLNILQPHSGA